MVGGRPTAFFACTLHTDTRHILAEIDIASAKACMGGIAFVATFADRVKIPEVNISLVRLPGRSFKVSGHDLLSKRLFVMN
jgi:hypothetical protein